MQADELRQWWHFDAQGKGLGHLAVQVARKLRGKDNPLYTPYMDLGAFVVVTNCEKVRVAGKKYHYKLYLRNLSRRPGHMKVERFKDLQQRFPERIIMKAVWGSMAHTPLNRRIFKERLKLFTGPNHRYYDKDIIDFPMWKIPDVTFETNLRKKDQLSHWVRNGAKTIQMAKDKQLKKKELQLLQFKRWMVDKIQEYGEEESKDKSLTEFLKDVQVSEGTRMIEEWEGRKAPEKKISYYPNTRIPVRKIEKPMDKPRDLNFWLGKSNFE